MKKNFSRSSKLLSKSCSLRLWKRNSVSKQSEHTKNFSENMSFNNRKKRRQNSGVKNNKKLFVPRLWLRSRSDYRQRLQKNSPVRNQ
jgi:hypothetical protein